MDYTQNLNLPQWEETDRIHHDDFNDAFDKIDAAMPRIVTGSYTGTGAASRTISLGGQPKAVFVFPKNGRPNLTASKPYYFYSALALTNSPAVIHVNADLNLLSITATGFNVYVERDPSDQYAATNQSGMEFHYVAVL